jgi:hypothetical protein
MNLRHNTEPRKGQQTRAELWNFQHFLCLKGAGPRRVVERITLRAGEAKERDETGELRRGQGMTGVEGPQD